MSQTANFLAALCAFSCSVAMAEPPAPGAAQKPAPVQPPAQPDDHLIRAEVPIVAGNEVSAKKRALADAFRQATEKAFSELTKEEPPLPQPWPAGVVQLKASLASAAQKYIRSYRLIEQQSEGGVMRVMVEIDVDAVALRRELDRARTPATAAAAGSKPVASALLVAGPAAGPMVAGLNAAGVRATFDPATGDAQLVGRASKQNAHAIFATEQSSPEGDVRGAARVAVKCTVHSRLFLGGQLSAQTSAVERNDVDWGFGVDETRARIACLERASGTAARAFLSVLRAPTVVEPFVTVRLDIEDAGVIPSILQVFRRLGAVTAIETRHLTATMAELRVFTRSPGSALVQALLRETGGKLTVEPTLSTNDQIALRVRNVEPSLLEENR